MLDTNMSWDNKDDVNKFYEKIDSISVNKILTQSGDVIFISNTPVPLQDTCSIKIIGVIFKPDGSFKNLM